MDSAALRARVQILETLKARRDEDHFYQFDPSTRQATFIDGVLRSGIYENWLIAANRSGKTKIGTFIDATLLRFGCDPLHPAVGPSAVVWDRAVSGWVVSPDFPSSRDTVQPYLFDNGFGAGTPAFIPRWEIDTWRVSDQILKLKNGSLVAFKSSDSGRTKFQGRALDFVHFDEEPPKSIYEECTIRVGAGKRLIVYGTCTILPPEGEAGGVSWIFETIIRPWQSGNRKDLQIFGASIYDNPFLEPSEIQRLESRYPLGSAERAIRLNGELIPGLAGTRAYPAFERRLHVAELEPMHPRRPLCWVWDFNVDPMVSLVGQYVGGLFVVYDEIIMNEASVPRMVEEFRDRYPTHQAEIWLYGDATGAKRNGQTGRSDYYWISDGMRSYPTPIRMFVPPANPRVGDRINAVNSALIRSDGSVGVLLAPSVTELALDLEQVLRNAKGGIKKTTDPRNPYTRRTHTSDAFGYWVSKVRPLPTGTVGQSQSPLRVAAPGYKWSANSAGSR